MANVLFAIRTIEFSHDPVATIQIGHHTERTLDASWQKPATVFFAKE